MPSSSQSGTSRSRRPRHRSLRRLPSFRPRHAAAPRPCLSPDPALDKTQPLPRNGPSRPPRARSTQRSLTLVDSEQEAGMRAVITTAILACVLAVALSPSVARAQGISEAEAQALREEIRRLNERLNRLEQAGQPRVAPMAQPPAGALTAQQPAPVPGEREINLREGLLQTVGLPKLEVGGARFTGFVVGSANFNSHAQIVPEFAGGSPAMSEPGSLNFRFDKFGLGVTKTFADWLSAGAAVEIESHSDKHSHLIGRGIGTLGCPTAFSCERLGAETPTAEATLDKFNLTAIAPIGNGLAISLARFDLPFGFERHDEVLNLTATTSEVFQFGRPQRGTGFNFAYQFAPWLDAQTWVVNRWENETTHDPFDDNNKDKTYGGRIGFTPFSGDP